MYDMTDLRRICGRSMAHVQEDLGHMSRSGSRSSFDLSLCHIRINHSAICFPVHDFPARQVMEGLRQKAMGDRLREMPGLERRVRCVPREATMLERRVALMPLFLQPYTTTRIIVAKVTLEILMRPGRHFYPVTPHPGVLRCWAVSQYKIWIVLRAY